MQSIHTFQNILDTLITLQQPPLPFTPGEPLFWDDPHISAQMLAAHLNPDVDAASRRPETIDRSVAWILSTLNLPQGAAILDLGCGPGLYASRLARQGFRLTGVDFSRRSIEYAVEHARQEGLAVAYRYQNYLELADENLYEAALLIYGDFCPLSPGQRAMLLANVRRALRPDGRFVLDVTTRECRKKYGNRNNWQMMETGFWKPGPHLVLESGFDYPDQSLWLDQYIVIETDGKISVYRNWFQDYTPKMITAELEAGGFTVESVWGDIAGRPYSETSEWIGVVARARS